MDYYMEMQSLKQELDLSSQEEWECNDNRAHYQKKLKIERTFEFLAGFHRDLDEVWGRILDQRTLFFVREVFFVVRREENR